MIHDAIKKIVDMQDLTFEEAKTATQEIMCGEATPTQITAFLVGLRMKRETVEELAGAAFAMKAAATRINHSYACVIDTCGTGGDSAGTFNISTAAAFVAAGAGYAVAKHGNRSVSSKSGSADVLEALGITITISAEKVSACLEQAGIAFLFAPILHNAMKYAMPVRKELGIRTFFNLLGPLTNPACATAQVIGVYQKDLVEKFAQVIKLLGMRHAMVVHGQGLDEIALSGETNIAEINNGVINLLSIQPKDFGFPTAHIDEIRGGTPAENGQIILEVLAGVKSSRRNIVLMNAAAAILVGSRSANDTRASNLKEALHLAEQSVDSGAAMKKLEALRALTQ
jgi:anthranilate phosphoribosyltransferase